MQAVELRPLSVGEILDVGIKIVWRNAWTFIGIVLIVVAPVEILGALIQLSALPPGVVDALYGSGDPAALEGITREEAIEAGVGFGVAILLSVVAALLATGACYKAIADTYLGQRPGWGDSIAFVLRRLHSLLWLTVLAGIGIVLGLLLCVVPGVWLAVAWAVAIPALLTEGTRGRRALGRSFRLVRGRWWYVLAILLLGGILAGVVSYAVQQGLVLVPQAVGAADDAAALVAASTIASILGAAIYTPLVAAFTIVLYFDLRVRKEGFDLALLAERIGVAPDPSRVPLAPQAQAGPAPPWQPPAPPGPGGAPASGEQPPYWPPPPGWRPPPPPEPQPGPAEGEQPPYWPPPPGWRPRGERDE